MQDRRALRAPDEETARARLWRSRMSIGARVTRMLASHSDLRPTEPWSRGSSDPRSKDRGLHSGSRLELAAVLLVATALVICRSLVYAIYEHADFDSDQAIVGLMAKHLSEGRALPLFFYGQTFMLGVEAWLMVPVFWLMGPTVAALKTSLILTNLALVWLTLFGLVRWGGLRPALALVPVLFLAFAPPLTTAYLVNAQGGNIEPLLYAALLWWLRRRPFWF